MKKLALLSLLVLVPGCGAMGYQSMSPEQLQALSKMKDANANCIIANTPWGRGVSVYVNLDKGVIPAGTVTIDGECKVTISNGIK